MSIGLTYFEGLMLTALPADCFNWIELRRFLQR